MPITKKSGRQPKFVAVADFIFSDVVSGVYAGAVDLPLNSIVTSGTLFVTTLFNSATTDVFSIGSQLGAAAAVATTYSATSADITAVGRAVTLVPTGIKTTEASTVGVVWTGAGAAPTTGVGKLVIDYIIDGQEFTTYEL